MSSSEIKLCVWVPAFNEEAHILATLKSILGQTYKNFDLIVSENHSTDQTRQLVLELAAQNKKMKVIAPPHHLDGFSHGQYCIEVLSKTTYDGFIFFGAHDLMPANYVENLVSKYVEANRRFEGLGHAISVVFGRAVAMTEDGQVLSEYIRQPPETSIASLFTPLSILTSNFYNSAALGLWNGDVFRKCSARFRCEGGDLFMLAESSVHGILVRADDAFFFARQASGFGDAKISYKKHLGADLDNEAIFNSLVNQCKWLKIICEEASRGFESSVKLALWDTYLRNFLVYRILRDFRGQLPAEPFEKIVTALINKNHTEICKDLTI